tara:strand:+ start:35727 stop:36227 length:501 start_codon:yes stop_codon:yes gene_type:complete
MTNKINSHYGITDYYNNYIKQNPNDPITKKEFKKVFTLFNKELVKEIIDKGKVKLPKRFGQIEIIKKKRGVYLNKDGVVINNKPVNWKATNELWKSSPEAKENKILLRHDNKHTDGYVFRVFYNKQIAKYKNKSIYFFKPVRDFSRGINKRIKDYSKSKFDAYIKK